MISCTKPAPQLPSNKEIEAVSLSDSLLEINEQLIENENTLITELIKTKYPDFSRSNSGFWYKITESQYGKSIQQNEKYTVNYRLSSLDEKTLLNNKKIITIGKKEIISGIEECMKLMNEGDKATIIIPWYLAYGLKGNGAEIKPYTSIIAYISIEKQ